LGGNGLAKEGSEVFPCRGKKTEKTPEREKGGEVTPKLKKEKLLQKKKEKKTVAKDKVGPTRRRRPARQSKKTELQ